MVFQIRLPAGQNQRFSMDAFDTAINKPVSIKNVGEGIIKTAEVVDNGESAIITIATNVDERFINFRDVDFLSFEEPFHTELKET